MKKFITLLALTLSVSAMADTNYSCFGTEPFWNFSIQGENATFSMGDTSVNEQVASITSAEGTPEDFAFLLTTDRGATASIIAGQCNDGMSDNVYTHNILYKSSEGSVFYGCCNQVNK